MKWPMNTKIQKVHNFSTASITNKHPLPHHFIRKSDFLDPLWIQTAPEHNLIFHYLKGDLQEAIKYSYPPMKALTNFFFRPENTLRGAGGKGSRTGKEEELLSEAASGPNLSGCYSPFCIHRMTFSDLTCSAKRWMPLWWWHSQTFDTPFRSLCAVH